MKMLLSLALLLATAFTFGNTLPVKKRPAGSEVIKMRVQSAKVPCDGVGGNTTCYVVQKGASIGKENWETLVEPIEGFNFEPGFMYDITVMIGKSDNPSSPLFKYTLVEVISKVPETRN